MKRLTLIKLGLVLGLGTCSWFVTSSLLAQARGRRAAPTATGVVMQKSRVPPAQVGKSIPVHPIASFHFDDMTVTASHQSVGVEAKVTVMDSRSGQRYMWSLILMDENFNVISTNDYANQVFSLAPGVTVKPTFKEAFPVRPGRYMVELRLYEVSPDMNPSVLNRTSAVLVPQIAVSRNERVTVTL